MKRDFQSPLCTLVLFLAVSSPSFALAQNSEADLEC